MRRGNRGQGANAGLMSLLLVLGNQIRQMDQKPPITIALVAGESNTLGVEIFVQKSLIAV